MTVRISDILDLSAPHIKVKYPQKLEAKLQKMKNEGRQNLHVVADFDCTLTKQRVENGRKLMSSFGMFCECPSIPQDYKDEDRRLCDIYKPIEVDPNLTIEEKTQHMIEWYTAANELLRGFRCPTDELNVVSGEVAKNLRDGVCGMFDSLSNNKIPVLVFSAGLGDAVVSVLKSANIYTPNVKVISNFLNYDDDGYINGMKGRIIHVYNKNETSIKETDYFDMIKDRYNVILMGDTLGDAQMTDGIEHSESVIKIGFLFHNIEGNLPQYMDAFDIVLIDDQSVDVPNSILSMIL